MQLHCALPLTAEAKAGHARHAADVVIAAWGWFEALVFNLTEFIYQLDLESQVPHKIVNLLFTITSENTELVVLWGS